MIEPVKVGDCYKLILNHQEATAMPDGSFRFDVNMKDISGDIIRCALKKVLYPPPATYIKRRMWFADGNTWKNYYTDAQTTPPGLKVNDYNNLIAKYGYYSYIYFYYPTRNMYFRIMWNYTQNSNIHNTTFSSSIDGVNWTADTSATAIGLQLNYDWHGSAGIFMDLYEIDRTTLPVGTNLQNVHIPELTMSRSWDTSKNGATDIIGHICKSGDANNYVTNDLTFTVQDTDVRNEVAGSSLRTIRTLSVYFSRVNSPTVKEPLVMPWSITLDLYAV